MDYSGKANFTGGWKKLFNCVSKSFSAYCSNTNRVKIIILGHSEILGSA